MVIGDTTVWIQAIDNNRSPKPTIHDKHHTMLTQALPYTSQQQQQQQQQSPLLTDSNSNSNSRLSRRFSLRSINSTTSATSIATSSSTQSEELAATPAAAPAPENKPSKNLQTFIRSLRQRRGRSEGPKRTTTATTGVEEDEIEMLSPAERPRVRRKSAAAAAEVKAKRSSVDSMFSWAAMTIYTYPGAAPVAGWF
jgi:hypothetical protein